ncbi:MAG: TonB-dependent receptor [Ferruginibacter sp.]
MRRIVLSVVIMLFACTGFGQATGKISGRVFDSTSNASLELATIAVFSKDSSLLNYQLSDKDGNFSIGKLPLNKPLRLNVSYVGYTAVEQLFTLDHSKTSDSFNIYLPINMDDTNAVIVKAVIPIRMNGDTLEINPAAFKMDKNAVVEELLNQVPGMTIWADGSITVNGRPIPKVLVDGKPFLNEADPRVATQNLPKSAIEKIQVFQEVDRTKEQPDNGPKDSVLTMNIKLKKDKKTGYFGKGGAGYGTDDRYEADLSLQAYNKKNTFGFGGGINNINKGIGNLQEMQLNNTYRNNNPTLLNISNFNRQGINKSYALGTMFTHNFKNTENGAEGKSMTGSYNFSGGNTHILRNTIQERTTKDFPQLIESMSRSNSDNQQHTARLSYSSNKGYNKSFTLSGSANFNNNHSDSYQFSSVKDSSGALQSTNQSYSNGSGESRSESFDFSHNNYSQDNHLARYYISGRVSAGNNNTESRVRSIFDSYTDPTADTSYNRLYNNVSDNVNASFNINYLGLRRLLFRRFGFFGISINLLQNLSFNQVNSNATVSDYDSTAHQYLLNNGLSNHNRIQTIATNPGLSLQKSFNKWTSGFNRNVNLSFRFAQNIKKEINESSVSYRNLTRSFSFFTPSAGIGYRYNKKDAYNYNINANYSRNYSNPTLDQLYPIVDSINLYSIRIGNPALKNTATDNLSINLDYNRQKPKAKFDFNMSGSAAMNFFSKQIVDSVINDVSGKRTIYYVNTDGNRNYSVNYAANLIKKIKKSSAQLQYRGTLSDNNTMTFIDGLTSTSNSRNFTHSINLQFALRTLFIFRLTESIGTYNTRQSNTSLSSFKTKNVSTQMSAVLNYPKNFSFNSTISFTDNSNVADKIVLWHAFGSWRFMKNQQGELKVSAFDLLRKFQNVINSTSVDGTTTSISNGLQQYFMLTFSYFPRKFGKKEKVVEED